MQEEWKRWQNHRKYYRNQVLCWDRYVKRMIRLIFQREGAERRSDRETMEDFYYRAIYQVQQAPDNYVSQTKPSQAKVLTGGGDLREVQVDVPLSVSHTCV